MPSHRSHICDLILDQLARGEMRLLSLIVAVRKSMDRLEANKGDLSTSVQGALRQLIAQNVIIDVEGVYVLQKRQHQHQ